MPRSSCLSVHPSIYPTIHPSVHLSTCLCQVVASQGQAGSTAGCVQPKCLSSHSNTEVFHTMCLCFSLWWEWAARLPAICVAVYGTKAMFSFTSSWSWNKLIYMNSSLITILILVKANASRIWKKKIWAQMDFIFQCLKWIINAQISKLSIELLMYWLFHDLSCELD